MTGQAHLFAAVAAGVTGLAVGSFGGVVADRVPHGGSILGPPSHCDSCDVPLTPRDNIPVVSYLVLRGRCRACHARIPARDLVIELVTAGLFVLLALRVPTLWALPAYCVFAAGLVVLSIVDIQLRRLPTPIVYGTAALGGALLVVATAATGNWDLLVQAAIGAAICLAVFFAIFVAVPKGMGFGDVRLAALCGGMLGWLGLRVVPLGLLVAFLVASIPAIFLVVLGKANRKSQLPFGPYLAAGALFAVSFGPSIVHAWGIF
ncbi:MAG: prepilin peptidase [Acidimicrobiales bacterium]